MSRIYTYRVVTRMHTNLEMSCLLVLKTIARTERQSLNNANLTGNFMTDHKYGRKVEGN